ncbi:hypothetical protein KKG58_02785 [Patescibacteria group bacterium]|nr:hypothetical protein [Patescibacteria group bacterium]
MTTITISKKITQGKELIIVPKKDWENLLKITKQKIGQIELANSIKQALIEVKKGKIIGPFDKGRDLIKSLEK